MKLTKSTKDKKSRIKRGTNVGQLGDPCLVCLVQMTSDDPLVNGAYI